MRNLEFALAYAGRGWPVFPLAPGEKRPHRTLAPNGFQCATLDAEQVRAWWSTDPNAGIGLHLGPAGLVAIDVDDKPGVDGLATLAALQAQHGELPATLVQRTPTGRGHHLIFRCDATLGNRGLGPGIDVRSTGGYIVAEPTHIGTGSYAFDDWEVTSETEPQIASLPSWVLQKLRGCQTPSSAESNFSAHDAQPACVSQTTLTDLRSALEAIPADEYEVWVRVGIALKTIGDDGWGLWETWSKRSAKYDPAEAAEKWRSFHPAQTHYRSVFSEAQRRGWPNPMASGEVASCNESTSDRSSEEHVAPLDLRRLVGFEPPDIPFKVEGWLPERAVTLLTSHGGVGKSFLAGADLAVCLAAGLPWLGLATKRSRVAVFSAEDDERVTLVRLQRVCQKYGVHPEALVGHLFVYDMTTVDAELYGPVDHQRRAITLPRFQWLHDQSQRHAFDVIVIDNASDTFAGNEIDRAQVRAFIRSLLQLVAPRNGSVLLLSHVSKEAAKFRHTEEDYSGSTAWANSARSRWSLEREDGESGRIVLSHKKTNWGKKADPILLRWDDATETFISINAAEVTASESLVREQSQRTILTLLNECERSGDEVSAARTSPTNAHRVLAAHQDYPRSLSRNALWSIVRDLERLGYIEKAVVEGAHRKSKTVLRLTAEGRAECGTELTLPAPTAPTAQSALDQQGGALLGAAAQCAPTRAGGVGESAQFGGR